MKVVGTNSAVSVITAVRNRTLSLSKVLDSWLGNENVGQVVIVDWGSDVSTAELAKSKNNNKILHVYVKGQRYYSHTQSANLGASLACHEQLLFLDADIILHPKFFLKHKLRQGMFYAGNWRKARNENEMHLNGQFFLYKEDFLKVNGYDERFESYGWDDSDLYERLQNVKSFLGGLLKLPLGLRKVDIDPNYLSHLPHEDTLRVESFVVNSLTPKESIERNRQLCSARPAWSKKYSLKKYDISQLEPNYYQAKQLEDNFIMVKPINGLGNRLRVLASCWAVAEALNKKLYICWSQSAGFSEECFESLFRCDFDFVAEQTYRSLELDASVIVINKHIKEDSKHNHLESGSYRNLDFWTKHIDNKIVLYEWSNSLDHVSYGEIRQNPRLKNFDQLFNEKLRLLQPSDEVLSKVNFFQEQNFKSKNLIGFHIRRGDALEGPWANEYSVSADDLFIERMKNELNKDPSVQFYLATDCKKTLEKFSKMFSTNILAYKKDFVESKFGARKANQQDALVEMLLLSKTSKIIGTRWSTFSEMAARIGNISLEIASFDS